MTGESDTSELLRIIANDESKLARADRQALACAADELDYVYRRLLLTTEALTEAGQHRAALFERVTEMRAQQ